MKVQKFYAPEDSAGTGNGNASGTVKLVYKGEEEIYDLSDAAQHDKLVKLAQKGKAADKQWEEVAAMRRDYQNWQDMLNAAKTSDEAYHTLMGAIEGFTGKKPQSLSEARDELAGASDPELAAVRNEMVVLKKTIADQQQAAARRELLSELDALESKYSDFDRDAVIAKAQELGTTAFEAVHQLITRDSAIEAARAEAKKEKEELDRKRLQARTEGAETSPDAIKPTTKFRTYKEVTDDVLAELKSGKASLHTDD